MTSTSDINSALPAANSNNVVSLFKKASDAEKPPLSPRQIREIAFDKKVDKLHAQYAATKASLKALNARIALIQRKNEERQKLLIGGMIIDALATTEGLDAIVLRFIDAMPPRDRQLFSEMTREITSRQKSKSWRKAASPKRAKTSNRRR